MQGTNRVEEKVIESFGRILLMNAEGDYYRVTEYAESHPVNTVVLPTLELAETYVNERIARIKAKQN